jgi:nitrite reductase/ring-hydroxylating ferredoxin subunit
LVPSLVVWEESELSEDFVKVAETKDIQSSSMKAYDLAGEKVCIVNVEGNYYAIGNVCTHVGGPLNEGTLEGYNVECPWHGSKFDIRTGEPTKPPARQPVQSYEVKVEGNNILLRKHQ